MLFNDRRDAGKQLASRLMAYKGQGDVVVLGLARGGVAVAAEVAKCISAQLSVIVVRKIGAPGNEELALGAVTDSGEAVFNNHLIGLLGVSPEYLKATTEKERALAQQRSLLYFGKSPRPGLKGKVAILVDDGIATGASMRAAIHSAKAQGAKKVVLAVPVAAPDSLSELAKEVGEVVCLSAPAFFEAVGAFYKTFEQCSDEEVVRLLGIV